MSKPPVELQDTMLNLLQSYSDKQAGFVLAYTMGLWLRDHPTERFKLLEVVKAGINDSGEE